MLETWPEEAHLDLPPVCTVIRLPRFDPMRKTDEGLIVLSVLVLSRAGSPFFVIASANELCHM